MPTNNTSSLTSCASYMVRAKEARYPWGTCNRGNQVLGQVPSSNPHRTPSSGPHLQALLSKWAPAPVQRSGVRTTRRRAEAPGVHTPVVLLQAYQGSCIFRTPKTPRPRDKSLASCGHHRAQQGVLSVPPSYRAVCTQTQSPKTLGRKYRDPNSWVKKPLARPG